MTLTETLDHLLSVFLRPLRTWIEREWVAPWKAAYDAAMQTKEQYRDGVYLHLRERLEGTDEHPLAEGVPVRPLPQVQDLEHLQAAVELLGERKIEDASPDIPDGTSLLRILGDSTIAATITELIDTNHGWNWGRSNLLQYILSALSSATKVTLNCISTTASMIDQLNNRTLDVYFPFLTTAPAEGLVVLRGDQIKAHLDAIEVYEQNSWTYWGNFYVGELYFSNIKKAQFRLGGSSGYSNGVTRYIYLGCKGEPTDTIRVYNGYNTDSYQYGDANTTVTDVELRDGARQPINIVKLIGVTEENIVNHIFNRLADNNDGDPITITLGSTNLAKLTDEEKHIAIDKNYILA